ncbi:zinc ribbon domain-containing protein [Dermatobacter hominis]|uniref:zinc ribbon domain-containing protein n=1 Tax=Dermatobacter hominis TaxID=2884263 RepID=UPI001D125D9B|nr:C4-type zinc ribbon domain-containing protein [Dermatobacter hominis]UDY35908.1 C4-type zinc ribbon domain-containing protein [Dermatobacter hominis]
MGSLDALIDVQTLDTRADQLRHRRDALPQLATLAQEAATRAEVEQRADVARGRLHELRQRQKGLEDEAALVEDKAAEIDRKLYDGSVVAHKELEAFQEDHRQLKARQADIEDQALEVMEAAEPIDAEVSALAAEVAQADERIAALTAEVESARGEIDAEAAVIASEREQAAANVPADVLEAYEATRSRMGGIGAARLVGNRCEGCHLEIPSAELEAVRKAADDAVVTCPECGRILVR